LFGQCGVVMQEPVEGLLAAGAQGVGVRVVQRLGAGAAEGV
jgi:hypothetical protein